MSDTSPSRPYLERVLWAVGIATAIVLAVVVLVTTFRQATDLFFLIFTALLFAICLNRMSVWIASRSPLSRRWALAGVLTILLGLFAAGTFFVGWRLESRISAASKNIDGAAAALNERLREWPTVRSALTKLPVLGDAIESDKSAATNERGAAKSTDSSGRDNASSTGEGFGNSTSGEDESRGGLPSTTYLPSAATAASAVTRVFSTAFGLVLNLLIVAAISIYLASSPDTYRKGFLRLFPLERRGRVDDVLVRLERGLWRWLLGRFATMLITGVSTGAALWFLGVPLPITVGALTALLTFIPNIGGIIALSLATLLALPLGLSTAMWVVALYLGMQLIESYGITPLIQRHQVSTPPALLIAFQALMGVIFGFLGLMIASPALVVAMILVNEFYVKDALGDASAPDVVPES